MKKKPKEGEATSMTRKDKQYWWCPTHKLWQWGKKQSNNGGISDEAEDREEEPSMQLNHNMTAIMEEDEASDFGRLWKGMIRQLIFFFSAWTSTHLT